MVLDESGYTTFWQNDKSVEAPGRLENLKEFVNALREFETLQGFLEHVSLVMENQSAAAAGFELVTLMTLHSAKGLEFPIVFLAGWEEGVFPNSRSIDEGNIQEERRLAYVGLTRAKERATITFAMNRQIYGTWQASVPSRFIDELPADHISFEDHARRLSFTKNTFHSGMRGASSPLLTRSFGESAGFVSAPAPAGGFQENERVFHVKFGYGRILRIHGDKLDIQFDHSGLKHVVASFVKRASDV
jgi:DNA helicase-2/ATP-dependent DNA helicase PcrA